MNHKKRGLIEDLFFYDYKLLRITYDHLNDGVHQLAVRHP